MSPILRFSMGEGLPTHRGARCSQKTGPPGNYSQTDSASFLTSASASPHRYTISIPEFQGLVALFHLCRDDGRRLSSLTREPLTSTVSWAFRGKACLSMCQLGPRITRRVYWSVFRITRSVDIL